MNDELLQKECLKSQIQKNFQFSFLPGINDKVNQLVLRSEICKNVF